MSHNHLLLNLWIWAHSLSHFPCFLVFTRLSYESVQSRPSQDVLLRMWIILNQRQSRPCGLRRKLPSLNYLEEPKLGALTIISVTILKNNFYDLFIEQSKHLITEPLLSPSCRDHLHHWSPKAPYSSSAQNVTYTIFYLSVSEPLGSLGFSQVHM